LSDTTTGASTAENLGDLGELDGSLSGFLSDEREGDEVVSKFGSNSAVNDILQMNSAQFRIVSTKGLENLARVAKWLDNVNVLHFGQIFPYDLRSGCNTTQNVVVKDRVALYGCIHTLIHSSIGVIDGWNSKTVMDAYHL
jgi:hypothetical protein